MDRSPYDILGMSGNVRDWTASNWELMGILDDQKVVRGGCWFHARLYTACEACASAPAQSHARCGLPVGQRHLNGQVGQTRTQ